MKRVLARRKDPEDIIDGLEKAQCKQSLSLLLLLDLSVFQGLLMFFLFGLQWVFIPIKYHNLVL